MKWMLWYGLALAALVAVVLRRDYVTPEPSGKFDARVTFLGFPNRDEAQRLVKDVIGEAWHYHCEPVGQIAPEGMLK